MPATPILMAGSSPFLRGRLGETRRVARGSLPPRGRAGRGGEGGRASSRRETRWTVPPAGARAGQLTDSLGQPPNGGADRGRVCFPLALDLPQEHQTAGLPGRATSSPREAGAGGSAKGPARVRARLPARRGARLRRGDRPQDPPARPRCYVRRPGRQAERRAPGRCRRSWTRTGRVGPLRRSRGSSV